MNKARTALVLFLGSVAMAFAQPAPVGGGQIITFSDPLGGKTFSDVATEVINALVAFAIPILGIMVVWGGIQLMTAAGNEQKISSGRKTLTWAAVGFAIVISWELIRRIIDEVLKGQ